MKKSRIFLCGAAAALLALGACKQSDAYTVSLTMPENLVGQSAFIVDSRTGEWLDSVEIATAQVEFKGNVKTPVLAMVTVGGYPYAQFVLEPGTITMTGDGWATGTPSNDAFAAFNDSIGSLIDALSTASEEEAQELYAGKIVPMSVDFIVANPESPFALRVFGLVAMYLDENQIERAVTAAPALADDPDVKRTLEMARAKAATSAGKHYVDITTEYDGTTQSLSQYVLPGHWTIVDFWASWCGPCRREIPGIKALYEKYKGQGLNVVGVAVRDEPAKTLEAMEQEGVTWPVMLNGDMEVLQTYGIMGIPCIMLINPDGIIVARDLFGQTLADAVAEAMATPAQ